MGQKPVIVPDARLPRHCCPANCCCRGMAVCERLPFMALRPHEARRFA